MAGFGHFLRFCREQLGPGLVLYLHRKGEGVDVWVGLAVSAVGRVVDAVVAVIRRVVGREGSRKRETVE
jgi:hypothetical protein